MHGLLFVYGTKLHGSEGKCFLTLKCNYKKDASFNRIAKYHGITLL